MIYDLIDALIEVIKQDDIYINYQRSLTLLEQPEIKNAIDAYHQAEDNLENLQQYSAYIDLSEAELKVKKAREQLYTYEEVIEYMTALKAMNQLSDELTEMIFSGISDDLDLGRMGMLFARHRR